LIDAEDYANIRDSVIGILFLGTPHRGSSTTQFPQVLANITNAALAGAALAGAARFTGQMRVDLLKSLEKDAGVLKTLSTNFRNQASNIKIISFIEQKTTPPFKQRVSISSGIAHA
jgi:ankyrin repeat domain-containing protein 50